MPLCFIQLMYPVVYRIHKLFDTVLWLSHWKRSKFVVQTFVRHCVNLNVAAIHLAVATINLLEVDASIVYRQTLSSVIGHILAGLTLLV